MESDRARRLTELLRNSGIDPLLLPPSWSDRALRYLDRIAKYREACDLTALRDEAAWIGHFLVLPLRLLPLFRDWGLEARIGYDLGSGAGVPGIGLKLGGWRGRLVLVERSEKKSRFLKETLRDLDLSEIDVLTLDAGHLQPAPGAWIVALGVNLLDKPLRRRVHRWVENGHPVIWITAAAKADRARFGGRPADRRRDLPDRRHLAAWNVPVPGCS